MVVICFLLGIFFESQHQFKVYEKKERVLLEKTKKKLNISKKLLLVGRESLSTEEVTELENSFIILPKGELK
ncbi:hypothetical protein FD46_GL000147 [Liquorilactobacillus oeni DSM 19972]|uniref:Uncharacterized protein n=2 Tax=Liquorilactobacillus oeni TaxID=303241 RepID=A0A0R1M791_9LACO|nr:hypothetical protein FD46_GL000147 [Liquorilactobacillus oeni DSM 19972]